MILGVAPVIIGDNVWLGPNMQVYTAAHAVKVDKRNAGIEYGKKIVIGHNIWIGGNITLFSA